MPTVARFLSGKWEGGDAWGERARGCLRVKIKARQFIFSPVVLGYYVTTEV